MLSILIPVYNYDVRELIETFHSQGVSLGVPFEIIAMEDGSTRFLSENQEVERLNNVRHICLPNNIGRSKVRNRLSEMANYRFLLFVDCDSRVYRQDYLHRYIENIYDNCIVNGGITYDFDSISADLNYSLRLTYGKKRENVPASQRAGDKLSFTTFNFMIDKKLFDKYRFDENLSGYGYEDLILGYLLLENGYQIKQIDNPMIHLGIDTNEDYIGKIDEGVENLIKIYKSGKYQNLKKYSKLIATFDKADKFHCVGVIGRLFGLIKPFIVRNLMSARPSVRFLDFYKIGFMCQRVK